MTTDTPKSPDELPDFKVMEASDEAAREAGRVIRAGGLVAFPTETVYGLGADATDDTAVAAIFKIKGRPEFNPLIIHVEDEIQAAQIVTFDERAQALALAFWPGALTLVLKRKPDAQVSLLASAGLDTIAVRAPANAVAQALLREAATPIAAPSANQSGYISPTMALHVLMQFKDRQGLNLIIDGGPCTVGVESTIVDLSGTDPVLLRPGGVALEDIEKVIGPVKIKQNGDDDESVTAPGQLKTHYAPSIALRINVKPEERERGESLLSFGPDMPKRAALNLSPKGDLSEAAANLFTMMRALDMPGIRGIAVVPIPDEGLGRAINNRLRRAATPTSSISGPPKFHDPIGNIVI